MGVFWYANMYVTVSKFIIKSPLCHVATPPFTTMDFETMTQLLPWQKSPVYAWHCWKSFTRSPLNYIKNELSSISLNFSFMMSNNKFVTWCMQEMHLECCIQVNSGCDTFMLVVTNLLTLELITFIMAAGTLLVFLLVVLNMSSSSAISWSTSCSRLSSWHSSRIFHNGSSKAQVK